MYITRPGSSLCFSARWREPTPAMQASVQTGIFTSPNILPCALGLQSIQYLKQTHQTRIVRSPTKHRIRADGCWTEQPFQGCAVLTADCLPVFLCDGRARRVAAIHAGWRGLLDGILDDIRKTIFNFQKNDATTLYAAFGPAISKACFEIGEAVYHRLPGEDKKYVFAASAKKWRADLYAIAARLSAQDVLVGPIPDWCTMNQPKLFYSHRRQSGYGKSCGRIVNIIWRTHTQAEAGHS